MSQTIKNKLKKTVWQYKKIIGWKVKLNISSFKKQWQIMDWLMILPYFVCPRPQYTMVG